MVSKSYLNGLDLDLDHCFLATEVTFQININIGTEIQEKWKWCANLNICVVKELMMKEIPNQELKLNLRSSVTIMFNLIEIKTVSIFFFRVLNIYNCSNN